ncbi:hypothetical protein OROMI_008854 [Orobanche minor]
MSPRRDLRGIEFLHDSRIHICDSNRHTSIVTSKIIEILI